jgi:hypothetical protein
MPKYCMRCGAPNDDQSSFCVGCGAALPDAQGEISTTGEGKQPGTTTFNVEKRAGEHKHILSDLVFKDDKGAVVLTAKRPSLLHENFDVFDAEGHTLGRVNRKVHLMGSSFEIIDAGQNVISVVQIKSSQKGRPPNCWLEDSSGGKQATFEFDGLLSFHLLRLDGSKVLSASIAFEGGGIRQDLRDLASKRFLIEVFDQTFHGLQLAGTFAAVDVAVAV